MFRVDSQIQRNRKLRKWGLKGNHSLGGLESNASFPSPNEAISHTHGPLTELPGLSLPTPLGPPVERLE